MERSEARKGEWVEVQRVVLEAGQRSESIPPDTAEVPYLARVKGFLLEDARVGGRVTIETIIGTLVEGTLIAVNPLYGHDFGRPVPELLPVGNELRALLGGGGNQ